MWWLGRGGLGNNSKHSICAPVRYVYSPNNMSASLVGGVSPVAVNLLSDFLVDAITLRLITISVSRIDTPLQSFHYDNRSTLSASGSFRLDSNTTPGLSALNCSVNSIRERDNAVYL